MHDSVMLYTEITATYFGFSKDRYWQIKRRGFCPLGNLYKNRSELIEVGLLAKIKVLLHTHSMILSQEASHIQAYVINHIGLHTLNLKDC
jgi:hypothetical protein